MSCCNNNDCAPVVEMKMDDRGGMFVKNEHGDTAYASKDFLKSNKVKPSKDERMHACILKGKTVLFCLYVPAGS